MPLQKTEIYLEFDRAMKDSLAKFSASEQAGMRIRFVDQEIKTLGKKLRFNEEEWTNYLGFLTDKSLSTGEKDEYFKQWAEKWNLGTYDPTGPTKKSKPKPAKRGNALDDIKLDDCPEPEITITDIEADKFCKEMPDKIESVPNDMTQHLDALTKKALARQNDPTEELSPAEFADISEQEELFVPITTNTDNCPSAKSVCTPRDYAVEFKPKPKDKPMSKSKQELLTELLSSSDGLSEEEVKKICVSTFCDLFKEVIDSVQMGAMCMLNQIKKDEDDK